MRKLLFRYFAALIWIPVCSYSEEPKLPELTLEEAIVITLANQKQIQISFYNIINQQGVLRQSGGPFDPVLSGTATDIMSNNIIKNPSGIPLFLDPDDLLSPSPDLSSSAQFTSNDFLAQGSLVKQSRIGTTYSLSGTYEYFSGHKVPSSRASQVVFQINQPLLRNFMNGIDRQTEIANSLELQAVKWETLQTVSTQILNTITTYWEVTAAQQSVHILEAAIIRLEKLRDLTQQLINGGQLAAGDINQAIAIIDNQNLTLSQVRAALYVAKQQLLFAMGFFEDEACEDFEKKFMINDIIPSLNFNERTLQQKKDHYIKMAFELRFDVLASLTRQESTQALVVGAQNQALPQLDFIGSVVVNDLHPAFESSNITGNLLSIQQRGLKKNLSTNYSVGLGFSIPLHNDFAVGFLEQQRARNIQASLNTQLLKQNLINLILQTINNQLMLHRQWDSAEKVVQKYNRLVKDETERLEAGFGSVFVLLSFETSLITAQVTQIDIAKQYVQNIAQMRFLTGTLIDADDTFCQIDVENVLVYPE